tara:strand:+ start:2273 stop:2506 length:234 start_codon:yes stop_codon:yes gene_type:complete
MHDPGDQAHLQIMCQAAIVGRSQAAKEHQMPKIIAALTLMGLLAACTEDAGGPPPAPVYGGFYSDSVAWTHIGDEPF